MTSHQTLKEKFIKEFLKCSVCLEENISTRRLPCRHHFCLPCLPKIADGKTWLKCPICRTIINVPEGGFNAFAEDVPFKRMTDFVNSIKVADERAICCKRHPKKLLELYCKTENEVICSTCLVKQHKGHDYVNIEEAAQERRECFQEMADSQDKTLHDIQNEISELQEKKAEIETETKRQEALIIELAEKFKTAIERRRDWLCDRIQKIHYTELHEIDHKQKMLQEQEDKAKQVKKMYDSLLEQPTDVEMMLNAHTVQHLEPSDRVTPIISRCVARITLPEVDVDTQVKRMLGELKIEKKLAEKLTAVGTIKPLHARHDEIKRIIASSTKVYVLKEGKVEVFSEQGEPNKVITGFHKPKDMAVLPHGDILVIDECCVKRWCFLEEEISTVIKRDNLGRPCSLAVDMQGCIYIYPEEGDKVMIFEIKTVPQLLRCIPKIGSTSNEKKVSLYINPPDYNIFCFNSTNVVVFAPDGVQLIYEINVERLLGTGKSIRDVAIDIYGHILILVGQSSAETELAVLDNNMELKQIFKLPFEGGHIAVNRNGLVHGRKDGQVVIYKYVD